MLLRYLKRWDRWMIKYCKVDMFRKPRNAYKCSRVSHIILLTQYISYMFRPFLWLSSERFMRWAGHMAHMGEKKGVCRVLVGKPEGSRPLGRPRRRWVDNIRMDLQEVGCGYMDWTGPG